MIDIELLRRDFDGTANNLKQRGIPRKRLEELIAIDKQWRDLTTTTEQLRARQNAANKKLSGLDAKAKQTQIKQLQQMSDQLKNTERDLSHLSAARDKLRKSIPNLIAPNVPLGPDESANQVLRTVGQLPEFDFKPKTHGQLGQELDIIDKKTAARVAGSRFTYLKGPLVQLQFALIQLALSVLTNQQKLRQIIKTNNCQVKSTPFIPVIPPVMLRPDVLDRMARLEPKEERYYLDRDNLYLVGSAEHTLGPMHMDQTLTENQLPLRYAGYSTSFRREAGSYGKDIKGILRLHQFDKIELESFTLPEQSSDEQDFIVAIQEHLMRGLVIPYRVVAIATGDMGDPDARQIDIESYLPGSGQYRETHTSDLMTDYQARRLRTKIKQADGSTVLAHMNDATAFAIGRTLIAIMENYQQADGSITVPAVLQPFVPFQVITK